MLLHPCRGTSEGKAEKHQPVIAGRSGARDGSQALRPLQKQTFDVPEVDALIEHEAAERQIYLLEDARVVTLQLGLEAGGGLKFRELGGVPTDVTGHLAAGWSGAHTGQIRLSVRQTLQRNTLNLCSPRQTRLHSGGGLRTH